MKFYLPVILFFILLVKETEGQKVYQHVSYRSIYDFLDEMATIKVIELNSVVKPYSRDFISKKLEEIQLKGYLLNLRQTKELLFYLKDFNKELKPDKNFHKRIDLFYYKDSLFTFSINPVLGFQYWSNETGNAYHRWNGAEIFSYIGKHVGIYANLRDNHDSKLFSSPDYLTTLPAAKYKSGRDYSEMRGGFMFSNNWGSIGLVKDHIEWGNYYRYPSILSSKAPSFTHIKLNLKPAKWIEFNYIHAWLESGVIDSLRTFVYTNSYGTSNRIVYRKKYMAANMYTFKPFKNFYASVGNSIIYSDDGVEPAYLIPFFLYKSVDHTQNTAGTNDGGQNSQFYIDLSSRQINHLHLYATLFFDDIAFYRLKENGHPDYYSLKAGFRITNLIPNFSFTTEFFQSYPLVYKHNMPTTTYESNFYNLGYYLQDNSSEVYFDMSFRPLRGSEIKAWWNSAKHGRDHESIGTDRIDVVHMFMDSVEWENNTLGLSLNFQIINDVHAVLDVVHSKITGDVQKYTPELFRGDNLTWSFRLNYGF